MYVYYRSAFIQFDGRTLVINNLLGKTSAPVEKIQAMAYKFVGTGLVLYLTYEDSGVMTKLVGVDFMSTGNIDAMNGDIKKLNPLIEVTADWLSKDQQKNNARYFRKPPTNVIGWLALVAGWLLGGVFTQFLLVTIFGLNK
jgi:hypothetical protein